MTFKDRLTRLHCERSEQNLTRTRVVVESRQGRHFQVAGKSLLDFCSNDYLGLNAHPKLAQASQQAIDQFGAGSGASHLICGHLEIHEQLEAEIASFVGAESAIVFSTGYMANLAIPQTFLDRHGLLLEDKLNHASILDAGQLSKAKMKRYPHCDIDSVERLFTDSNAQQKMLITDGVFSMDGNIAPVAELDEVCQRNDALLVVDDAHGFGVLGEKGGGCLQELKIPVAGDVLMMGTLGKSAGSFGAFIAGDSSLIDSLVQFARPYIYTTALPPAVIGASLAAIETMRDEPWRREKLLSNVEYFCQRAASNGLGLATEESKAGLRSAIQPIVVGSAESATKISQHLIELGFWVAAIRPPTVPVGTARLRITLTADHEHDDIDRLIQAVTSDEIQKLMGDFV
jgi:8-amino-7-oxononanoate synthase